MWLIKAYAENDKSRFKTIALQIAAHEARLGHDAVAKDLKKEIDSLDTKHLAYTNLAPTSNSMLVASLDTAYLSDLIVNDDLKARILRILSEYKNMKMLNMHGYANRRKILLEGDSGTGKTFTATIIASELGLPLFTIQFDKLVTRFLGETSVKLRQVFDTIASTHGVYFFDEFDAIGADRSLDNEVGEMRRVLNSFLLFIENDQSDSLILAATNNRNLLDNVLFRRFDDVLHYTKPSKQEIRSLIKMKVKGVSRDFIVSDNLVDTANGLSQAEIVRACDDAVKDCLINEKKLGEDLLLGALEERAAIHHRRA